MNENLIYHYTDLTAFKSIVTNGELWATNVRFLNDSAEFNYGYELIRDSFNELYSKGEMSTKDKTIQNRLLDELKKDVFERNWDKIASTIYVVSFSNIADLLSQWRGYTPNSGVCIGIDKRSFVLDDFPTINTNERGMDWIAPSIKEPYILTFEECIYGDKSLTRESQKAIAKKKISDDWKKWLEIIAKRSSKENNLSPNRLTDVYEELHVGIRNYFLNWTFKWSVIFKHPSFSEESESRLIVKTDTKYRSDFRTAEVGFIPYIKVKIDALSIKRVILSPKISDSRNIDSIDRFLKQTNFCASEELIVEKSKSTYTP